MGVKFQITGGPLPITKFSDGFVRATGLGPNWIIGFDDETQINAGTLAVSLNGTGNIILGNSGGGGSALYTKVVPVPVGALLGKTQFAELKWTNNAAAFANIGPGVALTGTARIGGNPQNGYNLVVKPNIPRLDLLRADVAETVIQTNVCAIAIGDTFRVSVQFGVAGNTLRVYRNGALQATLADSAAGFPVSGMPGIFVGACVPGNLSFSNFICGPTI